MAIVTHAAGRIKYWELWNEPEDSNSYCGDVPTMVTMAHDVYNIIKRIDPGATVVGMATTQSSGSPQIGTSWLSAFLAAGGGAYLDAVSFHGYYSWTAEDISMIIANYRAVLQQCGLGLKPMLDTEANWNGDPSHPLTDSSEQAAFLAKYYLLHLSAGVSRFYWYAYDGGHWGGLADTTTPPSVVNEAGIAFGVLYQWLVGSTMTAPCLTDPNGTYRCGLQLPGSNPALVIWNSRSTISYNVPYSFRQVLDLAKNIPTIGGQGSIKIGNMPVLLR
jgi:hypothetical protein